MFREIVFAVLVVVWGAMAQPIDETTLSFKIAGVTHYEYRKVMENIVTLTDFQDNFIVTLDYERDVLLINNVESQVCFLTRLGNVPISLEDQTPVLVSYASEDTELTEEQGVGDIVFTLGGTIPFNYVSLTTDTRVSEQCISKPTYWLDATTSERRRRSARCDATCRLWIEAGKFAAIALFG